MKQQSKDWFEWWVNPVSDRNPNPDPQELRETQRHIKVTYTPEVQSQIQIKVRETRDNG